METKQNGLILQPDVQYKQKYTIWKLSSLTSMVKAVILAPIIVNWQSIKQTWKALNDIV